MTRLSNIGVDLDGVCYDFGDSVERYAISLGLPHRLAEPREFSFYQAWGMDSAAFRAFCDAGVDAGYIFSGPVMEGASKAIRRLYEAGHQIHIKTHRFQGTKTEYMLPIAEKATLDWLYAHEIPYDTITFTADKTTGPKCDYFIEDQLGNYDALDASGVMPYLVNRDWNQDPGDERRRVNSIMEFAELFL